MPYKKGYRFHGNHYNTPGVYSHVESTMRDDKRTGALNIALIGEGRGGKPGEIQFITDPEEAKDVLKGGDLLKAALKAYNPVKDTRQGLELGGADLILAIRTNAASQAKTSVYQSKEEEAKIGEIVQTLHPSTTGKLTTSGAYTGKENKTYQVVITSEGTNDLAECTYNYKLATEDDFREDVDLKLSDTKNATKKALGDGLEINFEAGNYTLGDTFLIPCTGKVTISEFVYELASKDYGEDCNFLSHKLEAGTTAKTKRLTVYNGKVDEYEVYDNLGGLFSLSYTGSQKYAAITVTPNGQGDAIKLQTYVGADKDSAVIDLDVNLDPAQFHSIRALAEEINAFENYETEMVATINPSLTVHDIDFVTKEPIKEGFALTAVLRDLKKTLDNNSEWVEATIINREVSNYKDYPYTSMLGGAEGRNAKSFVKFLDEIAKYDVDYIVPLTDDLSIIAETLEHCRAMSEKQGKERRMVWGTTNGLSAKEAIQNVKKIHDERAQYVGFGAYDYDEKLVKPYILAAAHAGRAAFLNMEPCTGDKYDFLAPEKTFEGRDRQRLIDNGVLFFDEVISDYDHRQTYMKLVWDYTTFSDYDDPLKVERSTGAIADHLSKLMRRDLEAFLTGQLTPKSVLESARNRVLTNLKEAIKEGIIVEYRNVRIVKHRDRTNVNFEVAPSLPTNFTFIDITFYNKDLEV